MGAQATQPKASGARDKRPRTGKDVPRKPSSAGKRTAKDKTKPKAKARSANATLAALPAASTGLSVPAPSMSAGQPNTQDWGQKLKNGATEALKQLTGGLADAAQKVQSLFGTKEVADVPASGLPAAIPSPLLAEPKANLGASLGSGSSESGIGPTKAARPWILQFNAESSSTTEETGEMEEISWANHEKQPLVLGAVPTDVSSKAKRTTLPWTTLVGEWKEPIYIHDNYGHQVRFTPNRWRQLVAGYHFEPKQHGLPSLAVSLRTMGNAVIVPAGDGWARHKLDDTLADAFPEVWPAAQPLLVNEAGKLQQPSAFEKHFSDVMKHIFKGMIGNPNEISIKSMWLRKWTESKLNNVRKRNGPLNDSLDEFITGLFWLPQDVSQADKTRRQALLLALMEYDYDSIGTLFDTSGQRVSQWVSEQWSIVDKNLSNRPWSDPRIS